jgi:hypothetical protein
MICSHCGTEIADKALICYKCGNATSAPVRRAAPAGRPGTGLVSVLALIALVVAALYLGRAGTGTVPDAVPYTIAGLAAAVLAWRQWQRWRGRVRR